MKKLLILAAFAAIAGMIGCKSIEVEYRGKGLATWTDTNGVVRAICDEAGKPIFFDRGWVVDYFQHGIFTQFDVMHAEAGVARLDVNGYRSGVDSNYVSLVKTSFDGAALLTSKIAAAIATCGGSAVADTAISALVERFISKGGNAANATVTCKDGNCTVTDGAITESCTDCFK